MSRSNMYQQFRVFRGHHIEDGNPDASTVGVTSWTDSQAAADVYARNPSIDGMEPANPIISTRVYNADNPAVFARERTNVEEELGGVYGFSEEEQAYVAGKYGADPNVWEIANDHEVQRMFQEKGADMLMYPEQFAWQDKVRFNDGGIDEQGRITTIRPLGGDFGDETLQESVFTGEEMQVAGLASKAAKTDFGGLWDTAWDRVSRLLDEPDPLKPVPQNIEQHDIERYVAPRGAPKAIAKLYEPEQIKNTLRYAQRGVEMGAEAWYNTQPLRDAAMTVLGDDAGDLMMQGFLRRIAATSPRGTVAQNIRRGSYFDWHARGDVPADNVQYLSQIFGEKNVREEADGVWYRPMATPSPERMAELKLKKKRGGWIGPFKRVSMDVILDQTPVGTGTYSKLKSGERGKERTLPAATSPPESGYGHLAHKAHSTMLTQINESGEFPLDKPKASGFFHNLYGNQTPVTADSHYNRAIGLGKDTPTEAEYKYVEEFTQELAKELGISPAQFQAAVWMGAGDMGVTPVADPRIWMQMFNDAVDRTANHRGHEYHRVLLDFLKGKAPLLSAAPFAFLFGSLAEVQQEDL